MLTILCIATYFKGDAFLRECRRAGCTRAAADVRLAGRRRHGRARRSTRSTASLATPAMPRSAGASTRSRARRPIERIAALDDFDVETGRDAARALQMPGMGRTTASYLPRQAGDADEGARAGLRRAGVLAGLQRRGASNDWTRRVPAAVGAQAAVVGGRDRHQEGRPNRDELWRALDAAGDGRSNSVLEQFVRGDVYHVDSIVWDGTGRVRGGLQVRPAADGDRARGRHLHHAASARRCVGGRARAAAAEPPAAGGARAAARRLAFANSSGPPADRRTTSSSKPPRASAARSSSTRSRPRPASTCGGSGRRSRSRRGGEYTVPPQRRDYAGIVLSLARQEAAGHVGLYRPRDRDHDPQAPPCGADRPLAGSAARVEALIADYTQRFYRDFFATAPPPERPVE